MYEVMRPFLSWCHFPHHSTCLQVFRWFSVSFIFLLFVVFSVLCRTLCAVTAYIGTSLWLSLCVSSTILSMWPLVIIKVITVSSSLKLCIRTMSIMFPNHLFHGSWVVLRFLCLSILLHGLFLHIFGWILHVASATRSLNWCLSLLCMK